MEPSRSFRIMTFNLRCGHVSDGIHSWNSKNGSGGRKEIVKKLLKSYRPDIIGTQEGLDFQIEFLEKSLKEEYDWIGRKRGGPPEDNEFCAIFYKKNLFSVENQRTLWLSESPRKQGSRNWGNDFPRIVTKAELEFDRRDRTVSVFNTHLSHTSDYSRIKSAEMITDLAENLDPPVVILGDFNSSPESRVYEKFSRGFEDAYLASRSSVGPDYTFHSFSGTASESKKKERIDWIFCRLPSPWDIEKTETITYREGGIWPSDHYPVLCEVSSK